VLVELSGTPLVVDLCDATALRLIGSLPYSNPLRRLMIRLELASVGPIERRLMAAGSRVLFASVRDRDALVGVADRSSSVVVPNGVDLDYWHRTSSELGRDHVIFSGAMNYRPNDDAALFLLRDIMHRVWATEPRTRVTIVGRDPTAALRRAASDPRVTVTGFVDDMRPYLDSGGVFAAPLRFAAGIQNKLLEALAMEMEVVTSPIAAAGIQVADGMSPPAVIARDGIEFAAAIVSALRRVRSDPHPRTAGRAYVAEHFSWEAAVATLDGVLESSSRGDR
jgi:glycosyltransferase involved in cell wall biosynthesis